MGLIAGSEGEIIEKLNEKLRGISRPCDGVEESVIDCPEGCFIEGDTVYDIVCGGSPRIRGHVKNGIAYEGVIGGPDRPMSGGRIN